MNTKQTEALKLALVALLEVNYDQAYAKEVAAIREALAEQPAQQQEPVAWMVYTLDGNSVCVTDNPADFTPDHRALPLYTSPPASKPWVGLTDEERATIFGEFGLALMPVRKAIAEDIEAKLREKNA